MRGLTIPVDCSEVEGLPDSAPISLESEPWSGRFPAEVTARLRAGLVPLRAQQRTMGLLLFANQRWAGSFGDGDQRLIRLFAGQAALAIAYHHSRKAMLHMGLREDRQRIARDLHDGVVQKLFGVGMQLQAAAPLAETPALSRHLEGAIEDIDQVVADLRAYMRELSRTVIADGRLELGLRQLAAELTERTHLAVEIDVDQDLAAGVADQTEHLLLIAGERLRELGQRADLMTCRIRLRGGEELTLLEVEDDGHGLHSEEELRGETKELAPGLRGEVEAQAVPELGAVFRARIHDQGE